LRDRIRIWAEEEIRADDLPPKSTLVLDALLYRGEIERGELPEILGVTPYARVAWSPVLVISGFYGDHPMANDNADPDKAVDIQCETKAENESLDKIELEMKQQQRLMDSFSRLGWYDDREAVIAFCAAREKGQGV